MFPAIDVVAALSCSVYMSSRRGVQLRLVSRPIMTALVSFELNRLGRGGENDGSESATPG